MSTTDYDLDFLKEKGFFERPIDQTERIQGRPLSLTVDQQARIAYIENEPVDKLGDLFSELRVLTEYDYFWFWNDSESRLAVYRTYGEKKRFIFNQSLNRSNDYEAGKQNKLSNLNGSIKSLRNLFDIKEVVDKFYKQLWDIRLELARSYNNPDGVSLSDQDRLLLAQKNIDRVIFMYFLIEQDIIHVLDDVGARVPAEAELVFETLSDQSEPIEDILDEIFFERLNTEDKNEYFVNKDQGLYVPYLNGGLFSEQKYEIEPETTISERDLDTEDFDWDSLFDQLNDYRWLIPKPTDDEAVGDERNELTPAVLGHIYEKFVITVSELSDDDQLTLDELSDLEITDKGRLLLGNKRVGAYYTPSYITNENARCILWNRTREKLAEQTTYNSEDLPDSFGEYFSQIKEENATVNSETVSDIIRGLTILDPGVGSGAFPMAAGSVLEDWLLKLGDVDTRYGVRRDIVTSNLYGVDLLEGATDVCRLRLWLWLVGATEIDIDRGETDVEPLPNIDFNIRQGNSLIGIASEDYNESVIPYLTFDWVDGSETTYPDAVNDYREWTLEYPDATGKRAKELSEKLSTAQSKLNDQLNEVLAEETAVSVSDVATTQSEFEEAMEGVGGKTAAKINFTDEMSSRIRKTVKRIGFRAPDNWKRAARIDDVRLLQKSQVEELFDTLPDTASIEIERGLKSSDIEDMDPFHWIFEFPNAYNAEKGFDVVVGNPPHGSDISDLQEEILDNRYSLTKGRNLEVAKLFTERCWEMQDGDLSFVIPKAAAYKANWGDFREYITEELHRAIDLGEAFSDVNHEQATFHLSTNTDNEYICGYLEEGQNQLYNGSKLGKEFAADLETIPVNLSDAERNLLTALEDEDYPRLADYDTNIGRGIARKYATNDTSQPTALLGNDVRLYYVRTPEDRVDSSRLTGVKKDRIDAEKVVVQRIAAHRTTPYDHSQFKAVYDPAKTMTFSTVINLAPQNSDELDPELLTLLLDTPMLNWYCYMAIYSRGVRNLDFDSYYAKKAILPNSFTDTETKTLKDLHKLISITTKKWGETGEDKYKSIYDTLTDAAAAATFELYLRDIGGKFGLNTTFLDTLSSIAPTVTVDYERWFKAQTDPANADQNWADSTERKVLKQAQTLSNRIDNSNKIQSTLRDIAESQPVSIIQQTDSMPKNKIETSFGPFIDEP